MTLKISDFELLDTIITTDNRTLTIMPAATDKHFITQKQAYDLYKSGQIDQMTVELEGEDVFVHIDEVYEYKNNMEKRENAYA